MSRYDNLSKWVRKCADRKVGEPHGCSYRSLLDSASSAVVYLAIKPFSTKVEMFGIYGYITPLGYDYGSSMLFCSICIIFVYTISL